MRKIFRKFLLNLLFTSSIVISNTVSGNSLPVSSYQVNSDTIKENQVLYNGRIWRNLYRKIEGDQYLNTREFITGTVSVGSTTFGNVPLKYDIYNDEILTTSNNDLIIELNKEMVDSFTISYFNKVHHFRRLMEDSVRGVSGYVDVLHSGDISLFVKYQKKVDPVSAFKVYDNFYQVQKIYIDNNGDISLINTKKDIIRIFADNRQQIKEFIRNNKIKIRKDLPESFIPLVAFCNTLENR